MSDRPNSAYVKAGDVIRVSVMQDGYWLGYPDQQWAAIAQGLAANFRVLAVDHSQVSALTKGGPVTIEVQTLSDFASINDVASIVQNAVYQAGFSFVEWDQTRADFISKVETTGGNVPPRIPNPYDNYPGPSAWDHLDKLVTNLTESPMSLAIVVGAAVLLVIAVKR